MRVVCAAAMIVMLAGPAYARVLFGVGSDARSASKSDPSTRTATHCIDGLIGRPTRVTIGSRLGVNVQADSH